MRGVERLRPRYNLSPTCYVPVVHHETSGCAAASGERVVTAMRWGLVPAFGAKGEVKGSTHNARVESVESSGMWKRLLDTRRCLVLFDGYYEWKKSGKTKVPMFIRHRDGYNGDLVSRGADSDWTEGTPDNEDGGAADGPAHAPLLLAAIHDVWRPRPGEEGEPIESVSILTMDPSKTPLVEIHDRMPILLTPETAELWLDPCKRFAEVIQAVLATSLAHACGELFTYEVSDLVGSVRNQTPECILPRGTYEATKKARGIASFFKPKPGPPQSGCDTKEKGAHEMSDRDAQHERSEGLEAEEEKEETSASVVEKQFMDVPEPNDGEGQASGIPPDMVVEETRERGPKDMQRASTEEKKLTKQKDNSITSLLAKQATDGSPGPGKRAKTSHAGNSGCASEPLRCVGGCGFFGAAETGGLCSRCFKERTSSPPSVPLPRTISLD